MSFCFILFILGTFLFFRKKYLGICLRLVIYLTTPLVLYLSEEGLSVWTNDKMLFLYRLCFGVVALFVILTVTFTRRRKNGFRVSTMDFLIILIAIIVPNLTSELVRSHNLQLLAVEIIVFFFSYEVLINELRGRFNALTASTLIALTLIGIRGSAGF
jgi:UDP-GlcNAc:undecaprenyl-phosphate GlcNAc-1-phosphate transferase